MRFGKIDFLNLAPFDVFLKKYHLSAGAKSYIAKHKSYPSKLNKDFLFRRIDASFISSIAGIKSHREHKATNIGIIAYGEVQSVIVLPKDAKSDYQSATSNALINVLNLKGEVLIGDKALRYKYNNGKYIDMGQKWKEKTGLPFVFGRLCSVRYTEIFKDMARAFGSKKTKIPYYMLHQYSTETALPKSYILEYLKHIYYKIGKKEMCGLERFYRELRLKGIKGPKRF